MDLLKDKITDLFMQTFPVFYHWIVKPFSELKTFKSLIFGKDDDEFMAYGIFTLDEMKNIYQPGMNIFVALSVTGIIVAIALAGMKISSAGLNPSNRSYIIEFLKDLLIVSIVFFNLSTIYSMIFGLNYIFVELFGVAHEQALIEVKETLEAKNDVLGQMIINLCLLGLLIWANFYYMMRKLTIMMFLIMGPLMVALYLIPKTKGITLGWLKELIGTVMIQSIHAALYWIIALMTVSHTGLEGVILYIIFIPVAESLRSLIGLGGQTHNAWSKTGAAFGLSAIAGLYGSVKGAMGDKSVMGALQGAYKGAKDGKPGQGVDGEDSKNTIGSNLGTDTGTTSRAEKMLKAGEITSKLGKATFGMAGAVAGSVMGPGGSMALSSLGFVGGGIVGGVVGRAGFAGAQLGANALQKGMKDGLESGKDSWNAESLADDKLADTLAEEKKSEWAKDNKDQFVKKMKQKFPDAHDESIEGMWNKEVSGQKQKFLEEAKETVADIRKNDGSFAKADQLASASADKLTKKWEKNNKEQFDHEYDTKNPITSDMSKEDIKNRNEDKSKAWESAVADKKAQYNDIAKETAKDMSNGLKPSLAYISKDDFANKVAEKALATDKEAFIQDFKEKNGELTDAQIGNQFEKLNGDKQKELSSLVKSATSDIQSVKGQDLSINTAENLTNEWAKNNKEQFLSNYKEKNPTSDSKEAESAWNKTVNEKREGFGKLTDSVAKEMANGKPIDSVALDSNKFADNVASKMYNNEREKFVAKYRQENGPSDQELEIEFDNLNKNKKQRLADKTLNAVQSTNADNAFDLSTQTADKLTNRWAKENKGNFLNDYKLNNPNVTNDDVSSAWKKEVGKKRSEYTAASHDVASSLAKGQPLGDTQIDDEKFASNLSSKLYDNDKAKYIADNKGRLYGDYEYRQKQNFANLAKRATSSVQANNAQELTNQTADNLTKNWAESVDNLNDFTRDFKKENQNATESEIQIAFSSATEAKRKEFHQLSNNVAQSMTNGKALSNTKIDQNAFTDKLATSMYNNQSKNPDLFKTQYNDAVEMLIDYDFKNVHGNSKEVYQEMAQKAVNPKKINNAQELTSQTASNLTNQWAGSNQQSFTTNFKQSNPNATSGGVELAWDNAVGEKRKEFMNVTNNVASSMAKGKALNTTNIDSGVFADNIASQLFNNEKNQYIANYKSANPSNTQQIEVEFEKLHGGQRAYLQQAQGAIKSIRPGHLYGKNDVNTDYLATQLAHIQTNKDKMNFLQDQKRQNVSEAVATQRWEQKQPNEFKKNLITTSESLPKHIPLDKTIYSNKAVQGVAAAGNIVSSGFISGTGLKDLGNFVSDTKFGKVMVAGAKGTTQGFKQGFSSNGSLITKGVNAVSDGITTGFTDSKTAFQEKHVPENAIEKQEAVKNGFAYSTGMVFGVGGYQKGAKVGMKLNPYNKVVKDQISEVSDISHLAQKVDDGQGNMVLAKGAVQLVTDNNRSYIQVRDRTGQTKTVSRYGSGDSSMKKGAVVYQDLTIQNGTLLQDSTPYQYDSAGAKVETNRPLNINPTKLLVNRNTPNTPREVQEIQAYNQKVDSNQFHTDDVIRDTLTHNKKIQMVVKKDRSYMVSIDEGGNETRISPYGNGDARLDTDEEQKIACSIRNSRIVKDNLEEDKFVTSLQPSQLIPSKPNKRLDQRREFEKIRYKKIGGTS